MGKTAYFEMTDLDVIERFVEILRRSRDSRIELLFQAGKWEMIIE